MDQKTAKQINSDANTLLTVCSDLAAIPISFDICYFFANAERERRRLGLEGMRVVFIADKNDPGQLLEKKPDPYLLSMVADWRHYLFNLGVEMTRLFPAVDDVHLCTSRREALKLFQRLCFADPLFPPSYSPYRPDYRDKRAGGALYFPKPVLNPSEPETPLQPLKAPGREKTLVDRWCSREAAGRRIVTITLRDTENVPSRNSYLSGWQSIIDLHSDDDVLFIILEDYFRLFEPVKLLGSNVRYFDAATMSAPLRLALYEHADHNFFVTNGPAILCMLSENTQFTVFGVGMGEESANKEDMLRQYGLLPDEQPRAFKTGQTLIWAEDTTENLRAHVTPVLRKLTHSKN